MIDSSMFMEKFLQRWRFRKAIPLIEGESLLDFGGNDGELKKFVKQDYEVCNYDHSVIKDKKFDTIVSLAVIEHIKYEEVFKIISMLKKHLNKNGKMIITTPATKAILLLEILAWLRLIDVQNYREHKYHWNKSELYELARKSGLLVEKYELFQGRRNQLLVFRLPSKSDT